MPIQIDQKIIEDIKNNKCILLLGPQMTAVWHKHERRALLEVFCEYLIQKLKQANIPFNEVYARKNSYYLIAKYINFVGGRERFDRELETLRNKFFERPSSVYHVLAKIPFNTIINFGSDHLMDHALRKLGYEFFSSSYDYSSPYQQYLKGLDDKSLLVYNLLGSIYNTQSLVLTEADQLEFMRKIAGDTKLPDNVLSRLKDDPDGGKSYIFLGFNFEDWPFRFLLDILQLPKVKSSASPQMPKYNIAIMTQEFYQERFGVKFLNQTLEEFGKALIDEYSHNLFVHKNGYLASSSHESDIQILNEFKEFLEPSGLAKRIKFWDRSELLASVIKEDEIRKNLDQATVYVPFISNRFLNDQSLVSELKAMLSKPNTKVFPIITRNCQFEYIFPELRNKADLILPGSDKVLISYDKKASDEDYIDLIKKINSKVR